MVGVGVATYSIPAYASAGDNHTECQSAPL